MAAASLSIRSNSQRIGLLSRGLLVGTITYLTSQLFLLVTGYPLVEITLFFRYFLPHAEDDLQLSWHCLWDVPKL